MAEFEEMVALPWQEGDLLLIDFGAQLDGYCADLTRTVVVGAPPDGRQLEVYDAVRSAQRAEAPDVVLVSGADNPTTLNFLPEHHLVVVRASEIALAS